MSALLGEYDPRVAAESERVTEVMLRRPKTLPSSATVGDVRAFFQNPHVMTALLVDDGDFRGAIDRGGLPADAPDGVSALEYAAADTPTISPDAGVEDALAALRGVASRRLVVLDADGARLLGLVCLNTTGTRFCSKP
jgi:CBS domain-containing protein